MSNEFAKVRKETGKPAEVLCGNCGEWQPWTDVIQAVRLVRTPLLPGQGVKQERFLRCSFCGAEVTLKFEDDGAVWRPRGKRTRKRKERNESQD